MCNLTGGGVGAGHCRAWASLRRSWLATAWLTAPLSLCTRSEDCGEAGPEDGVWAATADLDIEQLVRTHAF